MNKYLGPVKHRQWQVSAEGFPIGPHEEDYVIDAIEAGRLTIAHVRPAGELKWMALGDHPAFADALRRGGPKMIEQPSSRRGAAGPRSGTHPTQPAMWQVSAPGVPVGPHEEDQVIAMIDSGQLFEGQVRRVGELRWVDLEEHPPFEEARRRASTHAYSR
jgi:hypothetical protein